ncbi:glycosyltransferase WbsX family protein [Agarilytica rhodophyticola]|uniref:glycosyltransferase WbsX family protein n=1 Tax=Agarilytica rhodophyticola TaxID=1737490 RepID=UPI000B349D26|nr:glycoside hydrolase family 99-like domain-containing protein [Agarilytica rhodophyticola]
MKKIEPKYIAFYLPQFHRIPENDEWWGEGFTEWVNTEKAVPLFHDHYQPRKPANGNYYNLNDINVLRWQVDLADKHNVHGFCFYHYWFKGKKLLEKPAELFLSSPDIGGRLCFSWANETWSRTWNGTDKDILIKQSYGEENDWLDHIRYLIPFFKDERYIKVNGRPMFLIYNISKIKKFEDMINVWNRELDAEGLLPIHVVETLNSFNLGVKSDLIDAQVEFEPWYTIRNDWKLRLLMKIKRTVRSVFRKYDEIPRIFHSTIPYNRLVSRSLERDVSRSIYKGLFPDWDNSARKSHLKNSTIVSGASPDKFGDAIFAMNKLASEGSSGEYIFVNAWNEWAEGAYLEPDTKYGTQYLEKLNEKY